MRMVTHTIDDYDIGQLLGRGGFASVYRARERKTGLLYALKIMEKASIRKHNMESRVANEIKIQSKMQFKGIVQFHCHFEDFEYVYMVLELCEGGNLYRYLKSNGPLNESDAAIVIKQLLLSLEYMHGLGVVHRDLKLSNVLLVNNFSTSLSSSFSVSCPSSSSPSSTISPSFPSSSSRNERTQDYSASQNGEIDERRNDDVRSLNENNGNSDDYSPSHHGRISNSVSSGKKIGAFLSTGVLSEFTVKLCDFGLAVQVEHPDEVSGELCFYF